MDLSGTLSDFPLAEVLQILAVSEKTGTLLLRGEQGRVGMLVFLRGKIVQATTDSMRHSLGEILLERGLITEAKLEQALMQQLDSPQQRLLGSILVEYGFITRDALLGAIRHQIQASIGEMMSWRKGAWEVKLNAVPIGRGIPTSSPEYVYTDGLQVDQILMQASRWIAEESGPPEPPARGPGPVSPPMAAPWPEPPPAEADPMGKTRVLRFTPEAMRQIRELAATQPEPAPGLPEPQAARRKEPGAASAKLPADSEPPLLPLELPHETHAPTLSRNAGLPPVLERMMQARAEAQQSAAARSGANASAMFWPSPRYWPGEPLADQAAPPPQFGGPPEVPAPSDLSDTPAPPPDDAEFEPPRTGEADSTGQQTVVLKLNPIRNLHKLLDQLQKVSAQGEITLLIMRLASQVCGRGILFLVREKDIVAFGQFGLSGNRHRPGQIEQNLSIPAAQPSILARAIASGRTQIGALDPGTADRDLIEHIGGEALPLEAFVVPMLVGGRPRVLLYGDNYPGDHPIGSLEEVEVLMGQAGVVMEKLILEKRMRGR